MVVFTIEQEYCLHQFLLSLAGRYQAVAENIHGRATCSAVVNPVSYSPTNSSRAPSMWSLSRLGRQQYYVRTREMSMPPSPATTVPLVSPRAACTVQMPTVPIRFQRETSAPPMQRYMTSHHLRVVPRQTTPPVQLTVPLPLKERSLSRTEVIVGRKLFLSYVYSSVKL